MRAPHTPRTHAAQRILATNKHAHMIHAIQRARACTSKYETFDHEMPCATTVCYYRKRSHVATLEMGALCIACAHPNYLICSASCVRRGICARARAAFLCIWSKIYEYCICGVSARLCALCVNSCCYKQINIFQRCLMPDRAARTV